MKPVWKVAFACAVICLAPLSSGLAQDEKPVEFTERNLSGPRLGLTFFPGSDDSPLIQALEAEGIGRMVSQFGWHFEHRVTPKSGGPSFVIQWVPLLAGVEYGKFIPSLTLALGIRFPSGYEFGLGPNILLTKALTENAEETFNTSLVLVVGKSFDFSGVSIPVNLAYVRSPLGERIGIIFGYAIQRP
jgi:hypothetical protein